MPIYAGIGSRETPQNVLAQMEEIGEVLAGLGWVLRSGLADGADQAFHVGALLNRGKQENYIPWRGFNGANKDAIIVTSLPNWEYAMEVSGTFHPAWDKCSDAAKKLHSRNLYQIAGSDLDTPVDCVVCWTKDGKATGGTGQAIRIAEHLEIPIFNLFDPNKIDALNEFVLQFE